MNRPWPQTVVPRYQQVKNYVLDRIHVGALKTADKVPSEAELVRALGVSRMTANRALRELTEEGHLVGVAGVGRFVADHQARGHLLEIRNISSEIEERGGLHSARPLVLEDLVADERIARWLEVEPGSRVYYSSILHLEDGVPLQLENRFVNPGFAPGYLDVDFTEQTPHEYLTAVAPLAEAEHQVQAVIPEPRVRQLLQMETGEPSLLLFRRTWAQGIAATAAQLFHPSSRYVLGERFRTKTS